MRVSREQASQNRDRILEIASKRFRETGFGGIGVADLMKEAGLTHGGFYGHFSSKDDLASQACAQAFDDKLKMWKEAFDRESDDPIRAMVAVYLTEAKRDDPGSGCPLAAFGQEVARGPASIRQTFTKGVCSLVDVVASVIPGRSKAIKRRKALAVWSTLVGAMVLARAVDDAELSNEILKAARIAVTDLSNAS
ncbi:TetR/AcrR family transcriptional regulator [Rhodopirellula sp. SWK7]|uniref:TetR/AcrR family transcriptional regulator n=1 Tax=Rhodopirellula sp. SWK7 TaxID=595460 RepID=UPI0005C4A8A3|nr:TetR/AcrR family transcriptional regulator [Rhodopirellula sp. SWK7]